jgi:hypothetical protein
MMWLGRMVGKAKSDDTVRVLPLDTEQTITCFCRYLLVSRPVCYDNLLFLEKQDARKKKEMNRHLLATQNCT